MRLGWLGFLLGVGIQSFAYGPIRDTTVKELPRIWSIEFKGLSKTKPSFIEGIIDLKAGDLLDSVRLKEDVQMLIRLPSVAHAYYQIFYSHDHYYRVYYHIEENFTLLPAFNIWTVRDRLWWYTGVSEYNLLGRNILLDVFYQNNGKHSYGINFRAPFLWNSRWGMAASFKDLTSDEPVYFGEVSGFYEYKNRSFEILGLFQWDFHNRVELGGSFFREQYTYLRGAERIENKPELLVQNKSLIKLSHQYYKVDQFYQYLTGLIKSIHLQTVMTLNEPELPFNILWNDLVYYQRLGQKGNLAGRLRVGFSTNNNSPFSAFVVDNHVNIRGVGDRIDRGTGVITLNGEYRHTFWENNWAAIQGVAFVDYGAWRTPGGALDDFTEASNNYVHTGGGARFILKKVYNATLRVDYGAGLTRQNNSRGWVLGLGQYF